MTEYRNIGRVAKCHGRKGKVVVVPTDGLPPVLCQGMTIAVVPPLLKGDRFHEVLEADDGDVGQLVLLSGVEGIGDAEALVGRFVLARKGELPDDFDLYDPNWFIGRMVEDEQLGLLGVITEVIQGPANDAWVVRGDGEVVVPVLGHLLVEVPEEGPIVICAGEENIVR